MADSTTPIADPHILLMNDNIAARTSALITLETVRNFEI
jgi:hypothetical protein